MVKLTTMTNDSKLNILMCCHLPLKATLGGAKVYLEAALTYRYFGHNVDLVGIDEIVGSDSPYLNEHWRVLNFPQKLSEYLKQNAHRYDVVEYESIYLPFSLKESVNCLMVARSVLLDLHMLHINIPRFSGLKSFVGYFLRSWSRKMKLKQKINQSLKSMAYADFVNVPNPSDKEILIKHGIEANKIIVQPYGLFKSKFNHFKNIKSTSLENKKIKKIAFVGTFDNRKGAVEFPKIIKEILKSHPSSKFILLGVLGMFPSEESIYRYIGDEYRERVEIHGHYSPEELPELLKDCSFGIFPSYLESFGFGVLEMMAMGLPVVGYNSPGINMLLLKELTVEAGNINELLKIFSKLIKDDEFANICVEKTQSKVLKFIYENQINFSLQNYLYKMRETKIE
jgi:glycosyltransferase involved in cell wall biosynthesis